MNKKLIENRRKNIAPNYSLYFDDPLYLVNSYNQYLYDNKGKKYLDAIGNINIVGHCNKHVIQAISKQSSILNTNTSSMYVKGLEDALGNKTTTTIAELNKLDGLT